MTTLNTVKELPGKFPHTKAVDLDNNGVLTEVFVMNTDAHGNMWYFPLTALDAIDKRRLRTILTNKNATVYKTGWELLSQITLGNGQNALLYFNQLVKVKTTSGQILPFNDGRIGAPIWQSAINSSTVVASDSMDEVTTAGNQSKARASATK